MWKKQEKNTRREIQAEISSWRRRLNAPCNHFVNGLQRTHSYTTSRAVTEAKEVHEVDDSSGKTSLVLYILQP